MIELLDHAPEVDVPAAEYLRLLGYPRGCQPEGRAQELAEWARAWYGEHGRPWIYARQAESIVTDAVSFAVEGESFASPSLVQLLRDAEANAVVLVAVSAGPEIDAAAAQAWRDDKPDEYFFLEVFGSAVVEALITLTGARLCAWADGHSLAVLPHYSPGYPQWDVAEQPRLLEVLQRACGAATMSPLAAMSSGMLRPKKSQLAVFGLTSRTELLRPLSQLSPCESCCFAKCEFRRGPYRGPASFQLAEFPMQADAGDVAPSAAPLDLAGSYGVNAKALARWSRDRLSIVDRPDGGVEAQFRYDGTTCTNMGRPLAFDYSVQLGAREDGYPIESERCEPAPGDDGYRSMCCYLDNGDRLLDEIADEQPLVGARLDDVLTWRRPTCASGCYCDADSRQHKWGLVLETIHFALAERERQPSGHSVQESPAP